MTDEKKERSAEVNAAGKAHYDEVMADIAKASKEWGPDPILDRPEEARREAVEYEITKLCQDLAHVRSLNAQALVALQELRGAQSILAAALAEECKKRAAAELLAVASVKMAQQVNGVCETINKEQKQQSGEIRSMMDGVKAAAEEVDEAAADQKAAVGVARLRQLAAEERTAELEAERVATLPQVGEEITIINTGRAELDGVTCAVVEVFDRDRIVHARPIAGQMMYSLQRHQWKLAKEGVPTKAIEGEPWIEKIAEGYDGRICLPIVTKDGEPGAYTLDFQIREQCEPDHELVMDGFLKWDGCLNVTFTESTENCMTHFCDPVDVDHFRDALQWVWTQGPKITHWDRCNELTEAIAKVVPPGAVPVAMHSGEIEGEGITVTPCNFTFKPVDGSEPDSDE